MRRESDSYVDAAPSPRHSEKDDTQATLSQESRRSGVGPQAFSVARSAPCEPKQHAELSIEPETTASAHVLPYAYFDPNQPIGYVRGGNLPHWRQDGVTYFVTWRTADSIPEARVTQWLSERDRWLKNHHEAHDIATKAEYDRLFNLRWERWLDDCHGDCLLADGEIRRVVEEALRGRVGLQYKLDESVVMPNHVHVLVTPLSEVDLSDILQAWKSFTAHEINERAGRKGTLWQKESFDHIVRNAHELHRIRGYIEDNRKVAHFMRRMR